MAKVVAVNISEVKGVIKKPIERGYFKENHGLEGDAHAGTGIGRLVYFRRKVLIK